MDSLNHTLQLFTEEDGVKEKTLKIDIMASNFALVSNLTEREY